jgi:4-aminobutyrate aminotransferase-like enzyme
LGKIEDRCYRQYRLFSRGGEFMDAHEVDLIKAGKEALLSGWGEMADVIVESGQGAVFKDIYGKEYIDCTSQAWSLNTGFNHPRVLKAVREQLGKLTHARSTFYTIPQLSLARKLSELGPGKGEKKLKRVSFCLHGSVATEGALKLALNRKPGKFIALYNGYHGRTLGSMSVSWSHPNRNFLSYTGHVMRVPAAYCYRCSYGLHYPECNIFCADFIEEAARKASDGEVSALIMESIQGNGGMITFPPEFHKRVRGICDKNDMLLIYDEVQTGFARVPAMFACELYDITPDILIYGKAIGGGFPLSGTLSRGGLPVFTPGDHGFTFGHFPLSLAAALENLRLIEEEKLLERCRILGDYILGELNKWKEKNPLIGEVRGVGLMIGVELVRNRETKEPATEETTQFVEMGMEQGVLFGSSLYRGLGNVVKIKPPVVITDSQVEAVLEKFEKILGKLQKK